MDNRDSYQDLWDHVERSPLRPDEVYEADAVGSYSLTELDYDPLCQFPVELANQLIMQYCFRPSASVRPGDMFRALSLEAEELLFRCAPPTEVFFHVLMRYMDHAYQKHKETIIAQRYGLFPR